jgi:hypothetical protein
MKKNHVLRKTIKVTDLNFDDDFDSNQAVESKARAIQVRRWRELKRDMRGGYSASR